MFPSLLTKHQPKAEAKTDTACGGPFKRHKNHLAVRDVLDRVGDKWSLLVIAHLRSEPVRFNELRRAVEGISQRMLTLTLRQLERDGLVSRHVMLTVPPQVSYDLTPMGKTLLIPVRQLAQWAMDNRSHIEMARETYDKQSKAGLKF